MNSQRHRDPVNGVGLPAVERVNGDKEWYVNGQLHRDPVNVISLPAYKGANGDKEWWMNGVQIPQPPPVWTTFQKQPVWTGQTCVITLETIQNDSEVCKCDVCLALILFDSLQEWLKTSNTCPHCRSPWINYTKYN